MLAAALINGILVVVLLFSYSRWLDTEITADVCLYGLLAELGFSTLVAGYFGATDGLLFLDLGTILTGLPYLTLSLTLCFDLLSGFFLGILTLALLICFYFLVEYFEYDAGAATIINLSALFSQLALLFFSSFDLFLIVLFWEAISIVSFLLVQHWSHRIPTYKAGLKVFTISQVGDFFFLGFLFLVLGRTQTTALSEILPLLPLYATEYYVTPVGAFGLLSLWAVLLSAGLLLKAAQFFFYPWLLDAMEAPVPISAQLHSSTLVVIGFYLFYRFQLLFMLAPAINGLLVFAGVLTTVGASVLGFFQIDGKRLLACSTASQLGYVVTGLGLGLYEESLLLLAFCCCNKAFTFVWFGVLMHRFAGVSDFRFIGGAASLAWVEHAGLACAVANFTILPGAFAWHAKSLFILGATPFAPMGATLALEVLQLTWFFSSLYLLTLYFMLFLKQTQGGLHSSNPALLPVVGLKQGFVWGVAPTSTAFIALSVFIFLTLLAPSFFGFVLFTDVSWASADLVAPLSYY